MSRTFGKLLFLKAVIRIVCYYWFTNTCVFVLYFCDLLWVMGRHWTLFQCLFDKNTDQIPVELNKAPLSKYWCDFTTRSKNKLWGKVKPKLRTLYSACVALINPHLLANQQTSLPERKKKSWTEEQQSLHMLGWLKGEIRSLTRSFCKWVSFTQLELNEKMVRKGGEDYPDVSH